MSKEKKQISAKEMLDTYFIDNRARLLEISSFLDRIDRTEDAAEGRSDFRYKAFIRALRVILESDKSRTKSVQLTFSDLSSEPIESATGLKASGASEEVLSESN